MDRVLTCERKNVQCVRSSVLEVGGLVLDPELFWGWHS